MPVNDPRSGKSSARYDVEILTTDDVWAKFGPSSLGAPPASSAKRPKMHWQRVGTSSIGVLCTLVLHGLLVGTVLLGTAGRPLAKHVPFTEGISAAGVETEDVTAVLFFLNAHSITPPDWTPEELAIPFNALLEKHRQDALMASTEALPVPELGGSEDGTDDASPTDEATGDGVGRAALFGRYLGQIKARIERAWSYPLTAAEGGFDCRVQIRQDRQGQVQEVALQRCGDDPQWQLSLVQAIQHASPLSGPPDEAVFSQLVTLQFVADRAAPADASLPVSTGSMPEVLGQ